MVIEIQHDTVDDGMMRGLCEGARRATAAVLVARCEQGGDTAYLKDPRPAHRCRPTVGPGCATRDDGKGYVAPPNEWRLSCGALTKDSFHNLRAPPASSAC